MRMRFGFILMAILVSALARGQDFAPGETLCVRGGSPDAPALGVARILTPASDAAKQAEAIFVADGARARVDVVLPSHPARKEELKVGAIVLRPRKGSVGAMSASEYRKGTWLVGRITSIAEMFKDVAEVDGMKLRWRLLRLADDPEAMAGLSRSTPAVSETARAPVAAPAAAPPAAPAAAPAAAPPAQGSKEMNALTVLREVGIINPPAVLAPDSTALMKEVVKIHADLETIRRLLAAGADVNAQDSYGNTALILASAFQQGIYPDQHRVVDLLVKAGARVNTQNRMGDTALTAATHLDPDVVAALVSAGPDLTLRNALGQTALIHQLSDPHFFDPRVVSILVSAGADVNDSDRQGQTVLMLAAVKDEADQVFEVLLKAGARVTARSAQGNTALHFAAAADSSGTQALRRLLKAGAPVDVRNADGDTPFLFAAAYNPSPLVAAALAEAGADVNVRGPHGETALMRSIRSRSGAEKDEAFLKLGVDVNARDDEGVTALMTACDMGYVRTTLMLIKAGAVVSVKDRNGRSALRRAVSMDADAVPAVQAMLDVGADPREADQRGATLLMDAAVMGRGDTAERVNALIKAGAAVSARDEIGRTALFFAVDKNYILPDVVDALVKAGSDVNARETHTGQTILMRACGGDPKPPVIDGLIAAGADVNARDAIGGTALMVAAASSEGSWLIPALLKAGADAKTRDKLNRTALDKARKNAGLNGTAALEMLAAATSR